MEEQPPIGMAAIRLGPCEIQRIWASPPWHFMPFLFVPFDGTLLESNGLASRKQALYTQCTCLVMLVVCSIYLHEAFSGSFPNFLQYPVIQSFWCPWQTFSPLEGRHGGTEKLHLGFLPSEEYRLQPSECRSIVPCNWIFSVSVFMGSCHLLSFCSPP